MLTITSDQEPLQYPLLNKNSLKANHLSQYVRMTEYPVKVLQIGEGNFLRGFFDWMMGQLHMRGLYEGSIAVTQPRPTGAAKLQELQRQDGLYHAIIRGIQQGERIEEAELIAGFSMFIDPYQEWDTFLGLSASPELDIIVSNTTEAGLAYQFSSWNPDKPIRSYPGKLTLFLYHRYVAFSAHPDSGLMIMPCELVERNGDRLQEIVLQHAEDWNLPEPFKRWVMEHNLFLNSLVDRIVTGFPQAEAESLNKQLGVQDKLLTAAEPYYLWAIEGDPALDGRLPLKQAGLNVHWVADLRPFQLRKVRILNGAHTLLAAIGLLHGFREVREVVQHAELGARVRQAVMEEIVPVLPLDTDELKRYAEEVIERFLNPFIQHQLTDIAMNSLSKFKVRLIPTLISYRERFGVLPPILTEALASLIRLYNVHEEDGRYIGRRLDGMDLVVRDDAAHLRRLQQLWEQVEQGERKLSELVDQVLGDRELWDSDLNEMDGLGDAIMAHLLTMERR
ncbi:tagaturonate reductase [Paenibacillus oenotherae]|uniref:Tagaturonate reductase n=1 Tax=Paenibacillus oenotherae TaxID=1435645 RepID=A0ABS7DDK6_9BACL|nr:tagaturonate reductase [Paenibacillus oenotherae]MBW7477263.1 tagaturonate reductase [Paenibacillus oenotherae]